MIEQPTPARSLVVAGPGTGKTAVACARVAQLIRQGVTADNILMFSFTRAAVAELRDRIAASAAGGDRDAAAVQISTLDSTAWALNRGLGGDDGDGADFRSFEKNVREAAALFAERPEALLDWVERFQHVIVDEAQDLFGDRSALVLALLGALPTHAGFTVFADPHQAIYAFTHDDGAETAANSTPFDQLLCQQYPAVARHSLTILQRSRDPALSRLFMRAREAVGATDPQPSVRSAVKAESRQLATTVEGLTLTEEHLVLFRRRADVLMASSYLSSKRQGPERVHRLRLAGIPQAIHPWVAVLLGDLDQPRLSRVEFDRRWRDRLAGREPAAAADAAWRLLQRAAGERTGIDVRRLVARLAAPRPPIEFCIPDAGCGGPILGTIHASKGRQAKHVVLQLPEDPPNAQRRTDSDEEARVIYVGATRAQESLVHGKGYSTRFQKSRTGRVFRRSDRSHVQLEAGRVGDFDLVSPVAKDVVSTLDEASGLQNLLSAGVGHAFCSAELVKDKGPSWYLLRLGSGSAARVLGALANAFAKDLLEIEREVNATPSLPPHINHLVVYGATTVAVKPDDAYTLARLHEPFARTGLFLAPMIKGFVRARIWAR